jgi:hypothetical protein
MLKLLSGAVLVLGLGAVAAQAADGWGIEHEEKIRFQGKVVDLLCELTGDCPADCGAGARQLGVLMDDGTLLLAAKNFDPFAGTTHDLIGFCGQRVEVDGLLIKDPLATLLAVQFVRPAPDGKWSRAVNYTKDRGAAHPDAGKPGRWFRNDPVVKQVIAEHGVFGDPSLKAPE